MCLERLCPPGRPYPPWNSGVAFDKFFNRELLDVLLDLPVFDSGEGVQTVRMGLSIYFGNGEMSNFSLSTPRLSSLAISWALLYSISPRATQLWLYIISPTS